MITIGSIQFETSGFESLAPAEYELNWINKSGSETLTLHFFASRPDLPYPADLCELRRAYRDEISLAGGGVISIEQKEIGKLRSFVSIFKLPQSVQGMTYLGTITFPFSTCCFVIKILCSESESVGVRESLIASEFLESGQVSIDLDSGKMLGWAEDPYSPDYSGPALRTRADDECYDERFPAHPLSRVRKLLTRIENSMQIAPELYKLTPFY